MYLHVHWSTAWNYLQFHDTTRCICNYLFCNGLEYPFDLCLMQFHDTGRCICNYLLCNDIRYVVWFVFCNGPTPFSWNMNCCAQAQQARTSRIDDDKLHDICLCGCMVIFPSQARAKLHYKGVHISHATRLPFQPACRFKPLAVLTRVAF